MVSSTEGSLTKIGWKRPCQRRILLDMALRYSSSVVAPMQCNSPRWQARAFSRLDASIAAVGLAGPRSSGVHLVDEQDENCPRSR